MLLMAARQGRVDAADEGPVRLRRLRAPVSAAIVSLHLR